MRTRLVVTVLMVALAASPGQAQTFSFFRIAATGDSPPDNLGVPYSGTTFTGNYAVNANGAVVFSQASGTTADSTYKSSLYVAQSGGAITTVVPYNSPMPGAPAGSNFRGFGSSFAIDGTRSVFYAFDADTNAAATWRGVYMQNGSSVTFIADYATPIPGQGATTFSFLGNSNTNIAGQWSVSGGNVAFRGGATGITGNYVNMGGDIRTLFDTNTEVPGNPGFVYTDVPSHPRVSGNLAVGRGVSALGQSIVFRDLTLSTNPLITVADFNTPMPGVPVPTNFGDLRIDPHVSGNTVIFTGRNATNGSLRGIYKYTWTGGTNFTPGVVVDTINTQVPGTTENFTDFPAFSALSGDRVVFRGTYNNGASSTTAVFLHDGEDVHKILAPGDTLDGGTVSSILLGPNAIHGDWITLNVSFAGSPTIRALYTIQFTPVPEPALLLLALPLALLRRR